MCFMFLDQVFLWERMDAMVLAMIVECRKLTL